MCIVSIEAHYDYIKNLCIKYGSAGDEQFVIHTTAADIAFEREKAASEDTKGGKSAADFSDACLESLAVYRKIAERMPEYDTFLFHGSAIAADGAAYIFTAKSGTGKSTHAVLWREMLGERAVMVNDDKPLLRVHPDGTATVYGTPWDGKHHLSHNIAVPVRAICILERAHENRIRRITKAEALPMLIQQAYRPADPAALQKTLMLLDRLNVKLFRLGRNMDLSAARLSYNAMKEEQP